MGTTLFDGTWDLTPADRLLIEAKRWGSRLGFAVMLLFFRARGRFPRATAEVDEGAVAVLDGAAGRYDEAADEIATGPEFGETGGDLLDAVAVQTLRHGGAVYVLPQEEMPDDAAAAALLRY